MDIRQLKYFVAVANEGNISNAARTLNLSQPPLSTQIRLLEAELGCSLFDRNTRHIQLTDAGRLLYERANVILDFFADTQNTLNDFKHGAFGTLRLGAVSSVCNTIFSDWILGFHAGHPDINYALLEANTYELIEKIRSNQIEVALVRTPFTAPDLKCVSLRKEPMVAVGSSDFFPDRQAEKITWQELAAAPLVLYRRWEEILRNEFQARELTPRIICINDDARTTAYFAEAGLGIGIVPASVIPMLPGPPIMVKEIDDSNLDTSISLICRKDIYLSAAAKAFIDFISSQKQIAAGNCAD